MALEAVDEEVSPEAYPELVGALLRTGRARDAQALVDRVLARLEPQTASRMGWICRDLRAHDLAFDLFRRAFPRDARNPKLLAAFELVARRSDRIGDLIDLYRSHAPEARNL